jgi:hypothetical protein
MLVNRLSGFANRPTKMTPQQNTAPIKDGKVLRLFQL